MINVAFMVVSFLVGMAIGFVVGRIVRCMKSRKELTRREFNDVDLFGRTHQKTVFFYE